MHLSELAISYPSVQCFCNLSAFPQSLSSQLHVLFVSAKMTARTYVLIFFFWAILTVITPTLIFLSENSRLASADSTGQKSAKIKTRKMMGRSVEDSMQTLMALVKMQAVATVAAQAPAPAPTLEISVEVPEKGGEKQNYNSKQDVMYKETVVQMLFEV
ncbi:uncharacterized protein LOC111004493 isoform X1 [Momordica charantia]|uniref:Uncharacterized protein LOC111004493 isoform X1 n=1 Tax=Momordica charantia TaxID=3673 RepID=A0A6J1C406_MOMCH|nr:uncharacterized protein LOC111004493 isoform X1 [Momordica charantia]